MTQGFSEIEFSEGPIFIKHPGLKEVAELNRNKKKFLKKAKDMGVMTEKELLEFLEKDGVWTKEEESFSKNKKNELYNLKKSLERSIVKKQKEKLQENIKSLEKERENNLKKRQGLIRNTAEEYSEKRGNEFFIQHSLYKDKNFKDLIFNKNDFEELSVDDLSELYLIYNVHVDKFNQKNLMQIAIEPFFTSIYNLFGDDLSRFFEKSHFKLSHYQINLLNYAKMFSSIFKNYEIPEDAIGNAEKIMDFVNESKNKQKTIEDSKKAVSKSSGYSHAGATREDMLEAGLDVKEAKDIHEVAKENGGELSMEDFIRIHKK